MEYENLTLTQDGAVAVVTLDRPAKRNALSSQLRGELKAVAERLDEQDDLSCVIVTGAGSVFCAGADIAESGAFGFGQPLAAARRIARSGADMCAAWERLRPMTIAAVRGAAIGGGLSLAVSCDFRILAPGTQLWAPEVELGINYTWNSLARIGNLVGPARAKLIGALSRRVDAETALAWGLCEQIDQDPLRAAHRMAAEIVEKPRIAQQMVKESVNRYFAPPATAYLEQDQVVLMARDEEAVQRRTARRNALGKKD